MTFNFATTYTAIAFLVNKKMSVCQHRYVVHTVTEEALESATACYSQVRQCILERGIYTVSQKKGATLTIAITLSFLGGFAKFFDCCKKQ